MQLSAPTGWNLTRINLAQLNTHTRAHTRTSTHFSLTQWEIQRGLEVNLCTVCVSVYLSVIVAKMRNKKCQVQKTMQCARQQLILLIAQLKTFHLITLFSFQCTAPCSPRPITPTNFQSSLQAYLSLSLTFSCKLLSFPYIAGVGEVAKWGAGPIGVDRGPSFVSCYNMHFTWSPSF